MALVSKAFSDIITFTRASTATYFDATGTLQSAAVNTPRLDYNPSTLAAQGLLIEEARTNSIRNNTMVGAVAGTPGTLPTNWVVAAGGLTANVIGTGTESGINYIDIQLVGTTAATSAGIRFELTNQTAAASGQSWSGSFYTRIVSGSVTNILDTRVNIFGRTAANASNTDNNFGADFKASLTAASLSQVRRTYSSALADATTAFVSTQLSFSFSSGVAIDITLRIGLPQLELGAFATSVITTTTTALTRAADVASVNTLSPWYNAVEGTLYAEYSRFGAANFQSVANLGEPTFFNQYALGFGSGAPSNNNRFDVVAGNVSQASITVLTTPALNTVAKIAGAYATNDFAATANGAVPGVDTAGSLPSGTTVLGLGCNPALNGGFLNGYLRRITYYPRRLTNAELQAITA